MKIKELKLLNVLLSNSYQELHLLLESKRFRKDENTDYVFDEVYLPKNGWQEDNTLYSELLDGQLEEISETEAKQIIATQFSREKQAA